MDAPSLTLANRNRLRDVVKRTHMRFYPRDQITDLEADAIQTLEGLGFRSTVLPAYGTDPDGAQHDMTMMVLKL